MSEFKQACKTTVECMAVSAAAGVVLVGLGATGAVGMLAATLIGIGTKISANTINEAAQHANMTTLANAADKLEAVGDDIINGSVVGMVGSAVGALGGSSAEKFFDICTYVKDTKDQADQLEKSVKNKKK